MISRLTGKLIEKNPPQVVIDVNGVGYEADVSMQTFYNLPPVGEAVHLYTQLVVREDAHLLFGFASAEERATFRQLVKVSGIGAKTALGILSAMNADELAQAIADGSAGLVARGQAAAGDKTMVDVWLPVAEVLKQAAASGVSLKDALQAAARTAQEQAEATIPLVAKKGRASYLGERSAGHKDPGAASSALLLQCLAEVV